MSIKKTKPSTTLLLPSTDFVAGFAEGEGCFAIKYRREIKRNRPGSPIYFNWQALFAIVVRKDDAELLRNIRDVLGCGSISFSKRGMVRYQVQDLDLLINKIVPFFEKNKLHGKKKNDFILWKEALMIIRSNRTSRGKPSNWDQKDLDHMLAIREKMRKYKSRHKGFKWAY